MQGPFQGRVLPNLLKSQELTVVEEIVGRGRCRDFLQGIKISGIFAGPPQLLTGAGSG
jgi:hypothetical protein